MPFPSEVPCSTLRSRLTRNSQHELAITFRGISNSFFMHSLMHNRDEASSYIVTNLRHIIYRNSVTYLQKQICEEDTDNTSRAYR